MTAVLYRAKHILLEDIEDAQYVYERIKEEGIDSFELLAKEFSECESSSRGGMLGTFSQGSMVAEFERALYHMAEGELSKPVQSKYGYHLIIKLKV